jgi:TPR repeat protein
MAQCNLGLLYLSGEGVRKDPLEASKWFTKSADQGNAEAQYQLGCLRFDGFGLRKDVEEAVQWFHKSALNGNKNALYQLGKVYQAGNHVEKDIYKAIKLYENAVSKGSQSAQLELAEIYEKGEVVDQDLQKAEKYYKLVAESDLHHQYILARKHMDAAFGNSNYIKAFELFKMIADVDPSSDYNMFQTPITYEDVAMDYSKLVDMFTLVLEQGNQELCYNIGYLYENGINCWGGVLLYPIFPHAIPWYSAAIANGDSRAKYRLGVIFEEGKGVEVDLTVAYNYYSEAYENGIDGAAYRLALMYMNGECVTQDLIKAYGFFTELSNKGHKGAIKKLIPSEIKLVFITYVIIIFY